MRTTKDDGQICVQCMSATTCNPPACPRRCAGMLCPKHCEEHEPFRRRLAEIERSLRAKERRP